MSKDTIQRARESLPLEYGWQVVNETGREVLLVRVPKAKPDYLHDLADVAFYVGLDTIKNSRDVLLVGHEKTARLEPQLLRDHIRAQMREDQAVVADLRRHLGAGYAATITQSPGDHRHQALVLRIPKRSVVDFSPEDVMAFREFVTDRANAEACQYAYIIAETDFERLGKRVLLELLGVAPILSAPPAAAPPAAAPAAPSPPATRAMFPPSPGSIAAAAPPAPLAAAAPASPPTTPSGFPSLFAQAAAPVAPAPPPPAPPVPIAAAPPPSINVEVDRTVHEEYEVVSRKPKAPEPAAAAQAPQAPQRLGLAATGDVDHAVHDEYEVVSRKPKAAPQAPVPAAQPTAPAQEAIDSEYEVSARAPTPPVARAAPQLEPAAERTVEKATNEYEVFTSKPKPKADAVPSITPPGMGGFQAALAAATSATAAPAKTREYEISGRTSVSHDDSIAARLRLPHAGAQPAALVRPAPAPVAPQPAPPAPTGIAAALLARASTPHPMPQPAAAPAPTPPTPVAPPTAQPQPTVRDEPRIVPPRASLPLPVADNGQPIVAKTVPANPELILAQRFKEAGYDVVEGLRAQGTVFAFAAHKQGGRRVLVKRAAEFSAGDATALAQLTAALGADITLVVVDKVGAGARLATWGTRIEVVPASDVGGLAF